MVTVCCADASDGASSHGGVIEDTTKRSPSHRAVLPMTGRANVGKCNRTATSCVRVLLGTEGG